jgi:putative ABC transport system permease protein
MGLSLRLAWRNLWRHPRRTWLTTGAMIFSNVILVFMISMQLSFYRLMIENTLRASTGHLQVQARGYLEDQRIRQTVPDVVSLADRLRRELGLQSVAPRASAFALLASADRSFGVQVLGATVPSRRRCCGWWGSWTRATPRWTAAWPRSRSTSSSRPSPWGRRATASW